MKGRQRRKNCGTQVCLHKSLLFQCGMLGEAACPVNLRYQQHWSYDCLEPAPTRSAWLCCPAHIQQVAPHAEPHSDVGSAAGECGADGRRNHLWQCCPASLHWHQEMDQSVCPFPALRSAPPWTLSPLSWVKVHLCTELRPARGH